MAQRRMSNKQGTIEHRDLQIHHLAANEDRTVCGTKIIWKLHRSGLVSRTTQITRDENHLHLCQRCKAKVEVK